MDIGPNFNSGFGIKPIIPGFTPGPALSPISPVPSMGPSPVFQLRAGPSALSEFSPVSPGQTPIMAPSASASFVPVPSFSMSLRPSAVPATEFVPVLPDAPKVTLTAEPKVGTGGAFKVPLNMSLNALGQLSKSIQAIVTHPSGMEEKINVPLNVALNPTGPNWVDQLAKNISSAVSPAVVAPVVIPNLDVATPMPLAPVVLGKKLSAGQKVLIGAGAAGVVYLLYRATRRRRAAR